MCYGVAPTEVSFANHSRVSYGLYEVVSRVEDGGDAFISAYKEKLKELNVEVRTNTFIERCEDVEANRVGRLVLNTGDEVAFENCSFTIHPQEILSVLPPECLKKAFRDRVNDFESSMGFFTVHGIVDAEVVPDFKPGITSIFPSSDVDAMMHESNTGSSAMVIMKGIESVNGKDLNVVSLLEPAFVESVKEWESSSLGARPDGYSAYKKARIDKMLERLYAYDERYRDGLTIHATASPLTYRDYLHSYDGSAYGIKQKMAQFNLFGRLPVRNMYAAGQSAMLPGIVGAMMSSFILARTLIGKEPYEQFINRRLS